MAIDFVMPTFLQSGTDTDTIHNRMMANLPTDIDKTQGGFPWDFTRPTAIEKAELLQYYLPEAIKLMFPMWAWGVWLDYHAKECNTSRKAAHAASGSLTITGTAGTTIKAGTIFTTAATDSSSAIQFTADSNVVIGDSGTSIVAVTAVDAGTDSNVDIGTINMMSTPIKGITSITNPAAITGGTDAESDSDLQNRIQEINEDSEVSYVGNDSDFKRWAEEVDGVGTAIVIDEWNGPETVKIVCLDSNGEAANQQILTAVYNHIMSPSDKYARLAPPNTILTVSAPTLITVNFTASVDLKSGYTTAQVAANLKTALTSYYKTAKKQSLLKYNEIAAILTSISGVEDHNNLKINGGTENIVLAEEEYPYTGTITITEGSGRVE